MRIELKLGSEWVGVPCTSYELNDRTKQEESAVKC